MKLFMQSGRIAMRTLLPKENGPLKKAIRIMKLTAVIILVACLQLSANVFAQHVTLKQQNTTLENIFREIKNQTGYTFLYSNEVLKKGKLVTISVEGTPLKEVLNSLFEDQPFSYSFNNKTILIKEKETSVWKKIGETFKLPIKIQGRVTDSLGSPLAGATVKVQDKKMHRLTNANGEFTLDNLEKGDLLQISYLGFQPLERTITGEESKQLNIVLKRDITQLQQVAVISTGYQKVNKSQLTGAASIVSEKDYNQRTAVTGNFLENLEGKVPGLVYNGVSGAISIRGVSTFDAVKKPLIVLDGFPTEIDLSTINPNDVVSVSVLRDAAATSIYGVQASNGVIVVETRRGKSGKAVFTLRSTLGIQAKPDFSYLKYIGSEELVELYKARLNAGSDARYYYSPGAPVDPAKEILFDQDDKIITDQQANERLAALTSYNNLKDYSRLFYQKRITRQVNLDVSGGNEKSTYLLGLNYVGERPDEVRSTNKRIILNVANTYQFDKTFSFDFKGTYTNNVNKSGKTADYTGFLPYEKLVDDNGNALPVTFGENREGFYAIDAKTNKKAMALGLYDQQYYPYAELFANSNELNLNSFRAQGRLNSKITSWLNLDLGGAYENQQGVTDELRTDGSYSVRSYINTKAKKDPIKGTPLFTDLPQGDFLTKEVSKSLAYTLRGQFNVNYYSKDSKHNISGILGIEQRKTANNSFKTTYFGYDGQSLISKPVNLQALNNNTRPAFSETGSFARRFISTDYFGEKATDRRFRSYYGQGTYVYDGRYVATGSLRFDQSNLFGVDPKYKNRPLWSAGLSWIIGEEEFMKPVTWVNTLQLRGAAGFNGNVPGSFNGPFLLLNSGLNAMLNTAQLYYDVLSPENQSIRWETTNNLNLGLDYGLLENRISGSIDLYSKKTKDVFGRRSADPTLGFNQYNANTASIENKGLEIMINSLNINTKGFNWRTGLTASFNKNKVTEVQTEDKKSSYDIVTGTNLQKGYPMNALFSYKYAGLNSLGQPGVYDRNGNVKVMNTYGDDIVDVDFADLKYSGTMTPKYAIGLNNQFSIGSFDFSFLFMYYGGHVMRVQQANPDDASYGYPLKGASNYWKKPGDELKTNVPGFPEYGTPGDYSFAAGYGFTYADQFVRKADYIRLRDVILTYNLKNSLVKKVGLNNTQLRFQAQNLFKYTFSGNDIDPESIDPKYGTRSLPQQAFYSLTLSTSF